MKKNALLVIVLMLITLPSFSQKITIDKTNQDGTRMISTDTEYIAKNFTDKNPIGYSISYVEIEGKGNYSIGIHINSLVNFQLPKGGLLLIKTPSGEVVEGKQILEDYETEDLLGHRVSGSSITTHTITGVYSVTLEDLEKIAKEGIQKIRIERYASVIDSEYKIKKTEKTQEIFASRLNLIAKALKGSSNIREGF